MTRDVDDDQDLVFRARAGDRGAFDLLITRYAPRLMAVAIATMGSATEAEDAVQEALARAWFKLDKFDADRPIEPWLVRVTLNKCRDLLRRRRWRLLSLSDAPVRTEAEARAGDNLVTQMEERDALLRTGAELGRLPASLREPLVLVSVDGRSYAEAGVILGLTEKAVEMRIYRARSRLSKILNGD